jgi:predicted dehydrogenase
VADAVIIAIMDRGHAEAVKVFADQGYDILCEKPIATSIDECVGIVKAVKQNDVIFGCGHGQSLRPV